MFLKTDISCDRLADAQLGQEYGSSLLATYFVIKLFRHIYTLML